MATLNIRNFPDDLAKELKSQAAMAGMGYHDYCVFILGTWAASGDEMPKDFGMRAYFREAEMVNPKKIAVIEEGAKNEDIYSTSGRRDDGDYSGAGEFDRGGGTAGPTGDFGNEPGAGEKDREASLDVPERGEVGDKETLHRDRTLDIEGRKGGDSAAGVEPGREGGGEGGGEEFLDVSPGVYTRSGSGLTEAEEKELRQLAAIRDEDIDLSDIPELTAGDFRRGVRGKFYGKTIGVAEEGEKLAASGTGASLSGKRTPVLGLGDSAAGSDAKELTKAEVDAETFGLVGTGGGVGGPPNLPREGKAQLPPSIPMNPPGTEVIVPVQARGPKMVPAEDGADYFTHRRVAEIHIPSQETHGLHQVDQKETGSTPSTETDDKGSGLAAHEPPTGQTPVSTSHRSQGWPNWSPEKLKQVIETGLPAVNPGVLRIALEMAKTDGTIAKALHDTGVKLDREILIRWGLAPNYKPQSEDQSGPQGSRETRTDRRTTGTDHPANTQDPDGPESPSVGTPKPGVNMQALRDICAGNLPEPPNVPQEQIDYLKTLNSFVDRMTGVGDQVFANKLCVACEAPLKYIDGKTACIDEACGMYGKAQKGK